MRNAVEEILKFLRWIAELIATKNWFALIGLFIILIYCLFTPPELNLFSLFGSKSNGWLIGLFAKTDSSLPSWYLPSFVLIELGLIIGALALALQSQSQAGKSPPTDVTARRMIKGLRPFGSEDAEIFSKLQRTQILRETLESITSPTFRFGILFGESGCGKTSFLQAGLWPQLKQTDASHRGIYIRLSDQDPIHTIAQAIAEELDIPLDWLLESEPVHTLRTENLASSSAAISRSSALSEQLLQVLTQMTDTTDKPVVLLLDQFEQFFVHRKRVEQRQPLVHGLAQWYLSDPQLPVKILISIRSDLVYQLEELHQALGYALGPQEIFQLKKFTPEEAAEVLGAIAKAEGLDFNRKFVSALAEQELASHEDGLVSPADLQILAWMIDRQTKTELRAFQRLSFQKIGGVEGLLQRFLTNTLEARVTQAQRESAVKVLLALTDLELQVRAGILTMSDIEKKLKGSIKPAAVKESVTWLARGDVRLITPQEKGHIIGYELAHERLIPALMQQAGKELSAVDKANQLLERRVNEWLGNKRQSRYLFSPWEIWQLNRQLPYLIMGNKQRQKEQLLQMSRRRVYNITVGITLVAIITCGFSGWYFLTPWGQIQQLRWQISNHLDSTSTSSTAATQVALAYTKHGEWKKTEDIRQKHVFLTDKDIAWFINESMRFPSLYKDEGAMLINQQLTPWANDIHSFDDRLISLQDIASTAARLVGVDAATLLFHQLIDEINNIKDEHNKSVALQSLAGAIAQLDNLENSDTLDRLFHQLTSAANNIKGEDNKSDALLGIAYAYAPIDNTDSTTMLLQQLISDYAESGYFKNIARTVVRLRDTDTVGTFFKQLIDTASTLTDDDQKFGALQYLADAYAPIDNTNVTTTLLQQLTSTSTNIGSKHAISGLLKDIAEASLQLKNPDAVITIFKQLINTATTLPDQDSRISTLKGITRAYSSQANHIDAKHQKQIIDVVINLSENDRFLIMQELLFPISLIEEVVAESATLLGRLNHVNAELSLINKNDEHNILQKVSNIIVVSRVARDISLHLTDLEEFRRLFAPHIKDDKLRGQLINSLLVGSRVESYLRSENQLHPIFNLLQNEVPIEKDFPDISERLHSMSIDAELPATFLNDVITNLPKNEKFLNLLDSQRGNILSEIFDIFRGEVVDATLLKQRLNAVSNLPDNRTKWSVLYNIAAATEKLDSTDANAALIAQILSSVFELNDLNNTTEYSILRSLARATARLNNENTAAILFQQLIDAADNIPEGNNKSQTLLAMAHTAERLPGTTLRQDLLEKTLISAVRESANDVMVSVATSYAKQRQWGKALAALQKCPDESKIVGLAKVFTIHAEAQDIRLVPGPVALLTGDKGVRATGNAGDYTLEVNIHSPDKDCMHYTDWVEVLTPAGILKGQTHYEYPNLETMKDNHIFTARLTEVNMQLEEEVIIRAHYHGVYATGPSSQADKSGYTEQALRGSVANGFHHIRFSEEYAGWLAKDNPSRTQEKCKFELGFTPPWLYEGDR